MVVEAVTGLGFWIVELLFQGLNIVSIPLNLMNVLLDFLKFGAWVVGADVLGVVIASISFWLWFKFASGLLLFIWRLLPLT